MLKLNTLSLFDHGPLFISNLNDLNIVLEKKWIKMSDMKYTQSPKFHGTTAFPQVLATYLIFVQWNIFLGSVLCKYLLSKTRTCVLSFSACYRILREGLFRCCKHTEYHRTYTLPISIHRFNRMKFSLMLNILYSTIVFLNNWQTICFAPVQ